MEAQNPSYEELKKLMEEKDSLVKEGKYLEAEEIRKKIISIKNDSSSQKKRFFAFPSSQAKTDFRS